MNSVKIPLCNRYLPVDQATDILYSIVVSNQKLRESTESAKAFHALLVAKNIIDPDHPLPKTLPGLTCYDLYQIHRRGSLCHMCPYSHNYRNTYENEETSLLSYALKSYGNLQTVKSTGIQPENFKAYFLINDNPPEGFLSALPLNMMIYKYLSRDVQAASDLENLPVKFTESLKTEKNKTKILEESLVVIQNFVVQLKNAQVSITRDKAIEFAHVIKYGKKAESTEPEGKKDDKKDNADCIAGLLAGKAETGPIINPSKETAAVVPQSEVLSHPNSFSEKCLDDTPFSLYSAQKSENIYNSLESFLEFNPMLGMEIVIDQDSKKEMLLLCASNQFFYLEPDDEDVLCLLSSYFSKSRARKQICMEPYQLYFYLFTKGIMFDNVFSLLTAHKLLTELRGNAYTVPTPEKLARELLSKENQYHYPRYVFLMPLYVKMYEVLSGHPQLHSDESNFKLRRQSAIDSLMGISYEYLLSNRKKQPLFTIDENGNPEFTYKEGQPLMDGTCSVTFSFSSEKPVENLIYNILYKIEKRRLPLLYGYRLLKYTNASITLSTPVEEIAQLREVISNLAAYLSERDQLIPLYLKENLFVSNDQKNVR